MCYVIPMGSAIATSFVWRTKKEQKVWWLNLMFYGGALFGVIDHLWNKELFLISDNLMKDLLLGLVISVSIFASWFVILTLSKTNPVLSQYADIKLDKIKA